MKNSYIIVLVMMLSSCGSSIPGITNVVFPDDGQTIKKIPRKFQGYFEYVDLELAREREKRFEERKLILEKNREPREEAIVYYEPPVKDLISIKEIEKGFVEVKSFHAIKKSLLPYRDTLMEMNYYMKSGYLYVEKFYSGENSFDIYTYREKNGYLLYKESILLLFDYLEQESWGSFMGFSLGFGLIDHKKENFYFKEKEGDLYLNFVVEDSLYSPIIVKEQGNNLKLVGLDTDSIIEYNKSLNNGKYAGTHLRIEEKQINGIMSTEKFWRDFLLLIPFSMKNSN